MSTIKFSNLPVHVRQYIFDQHKKSKAVEALDRMRFYAQNGYNSAAEYRKVVEHEQPTTNDMKTFIVEAVKHFSKNGYQVWMDMIPNSKWIIQCYNESTMLTKAGC